MPIIVQLCPETFDPPVGLTDLHATAGVHELVLVGTHHLMDGARLAVLRRGLAPHCLVALLIDDHVPAAERAVVDELLNDGTIPVLITRGESAAAGLTCWLDPDDTPLPDLWQPVDVSRESSSRVRRVAPRHRRFPFFRCRRPPTRRRGR